MVLWDARVIKTTGHEIQVMGYCEYRGNDSVHVLFINVFRDKKLVFIQSFNHCS